MSVVTAALSLSLDRRISAYHETVRYIQASCVAIHDNEQQRHHYLIPAWCHSHTHALHR